MLSVTTYLDGEDLAAKVISDSEYGVVMDMLASFAYADDEIRTKNIDDLAGEFTGSEMHQCIAEFLRDLANKIDDVESGHADPE